MASDIQFEVDDTSSMISYVPFGDTLSTVNLSAGWNPYFDGSGFLTSLGEEGSGTSMHITALDGASLSIQWRGTAIELYGNTTDATYSISIDNTAWITEASTPDSANLLASVNNLSNADHTLTLTAHTTSDQQTQSFVVFDRALISSRPPDSTSSTNSQFTLQSITDSTIGFNGEWSFNNGLGEAFRQSTTSGDTASVSFLGTSFLVYGSTSPDGGNLSVTLDNEQIFLTAQSSFTNDGALLYYSSGLDPTVVHNFSISNNDGSQLILPVGGFRAFATSNSSPSASATSSQNNSGFPAGTIAALVLAGVLVAVLLAWLFFYLFFYRPRMRDARSGHAGSFSKEADGVPDIRHGVSPSFQPRRNSNGFFRWKKDVESSGDLGIDLVFRHGAPMKEAGPGNPTVDLPSSDPHSQNRSKGKGKSRWFGLHEKEDSHSSPSFTLDLPLPADDRLAPPSGQASRSRSRSPSSVMSYLSTASFASRKSSSLRRQKVAPSRPPIPKYPARSSSLKPFMQYQAENPHVSTLSVAPVKHSSQRMSDVSVGSRILVNDRGSVRYSQDALSVFGPQAALRGLSPRTSERASGPLQGLALFEDNSRHSGPVLDVRNSSPFQVETGDSQRPRISSSVASAVHGDRSLRRLSTASHVRFEGVESSSNLVSDNESQDEPDIVVERRTSRPDSLRGGIISFLDFGGSSDDSSRTQSQQESSSSDHNHSERALTSRWSSTTGTAPQESDHGSHISSISPQSLSPSAIFPFPTSLPPSPHHPEGHRPSPPRRESVVSDSQLHAEMSPTESVPVSISASDLRFGAIRQSDSEEAGPSSRPNPYLPPHPPLPHNYGEAL